MHDKARLFQGLLAACLLGLVLHYSVYQSGAATTALSARGTRVLASKEPGPADDVPTLHDGDGGMPPALPHKQRHPPAAAAAAAASAATATLQRKPLNELEPLPRLTEAEAAAVCKRAANVDPPGNVDWINVHTMLPVRSPTKIPPDELAAHEPGTPYCKCTRGFVAKGHRRVIGFNFGHWKSMKDWSLFPASCPDCGCVPEPVQVALPTNATTTALETRLREGETLVAGGLEPAHASPPPARTEAPFQQQCSILRENGAEPSGFELEMGCDTPVLDATSVVWIAGRKTNSLDETIIMEELQVSVFSACRVTTQPLHLHVMLSETDFSNRTRCTMCWLAATCEHGLQANPNRPRQPIPVKFSTYPLIDAIKDWFRDSGVVQFSHKSTWYGYTKLWLPEILHDIDLVMFVDTDAVFVQSPSLLLAVAGQFTPFQALAATCTGHRLYANRINSGAMVMSLHRMRAFGWRDVVRSAIETSRQLASGVSTEGWTTDGACEPFKFGVMPRSMCLVKPCRFNKEGRPPLDSGLKLQQICAEEDRDTEWFADAGDQEFISVPHMEWFFDLGKRHIHWTTRFTSDMYAFVDPVKSKPAEISELIVLHNEDVAMAAYCSTRISSGKLGPLLPVLRDFPRNGSEMAALHHPEHCAQCPPKLGNAAGKYQKCKFRFSA